MAVIRLRHIDPLGAMYVFAVGRELGPGEVFEVDEAAAGKAATDDDPGHGLLGQLGANYELVTDPKPAKSAPTANEG